MTVGVVRAELQPLTKPFGSSKDEAVIKPLAQICVDEETGPVGIQSIQIPVNQVTREPIGVECVNIIRSAPVLVIPKYHEIVRQLVLDPTKDVIDGWAF